MLGAPTQTYSISLSKDGRKWTTVVPVRESRNSEGENSQREEFDIPPTEATYMRVNITKTNVPCGHIFQAVIHQPFKRRKELDDRRPFA